MAQKLVVIFVNHAEQLEDLLEGLLEVGVGGATVVDSVGMGRILSRDVPIFAGIRKLFPGMSPDSKVLLIVADEGLVQGIMDVFEDVSGPLDEPGTGLAVVLPVDDVRGLRRGL